MEQYISAALNEDIPALQRLAIRHKNSFDDLHRTALMVAAQNNKILSVKQLISGEFRAKTDTGETALMLAASNGVIDAVKELKECELNMANQQGLTALMFAAYFGYKKCCVELVEEAGKSTPENVCALGLAIMQDNVKVVEFLSDKETLANGQTILMLAAHFNSIKCVEKFIHQIDQEDDFKKSALIYAVQANNVKIVDMLIQEVENSTHSPLIASLATNNHVLIDKFKSHVNRADPSNKTALMIAAELKNPYLVKLFLSEAGQQSSDGVTASMILAKHGMFEELRLTFPIEKSLTDSNKASILHYAAQSHNIELIKFLKPHLEQSLDKFGKSASFYAIRTDNSQACQNLISRTDASLVTELMYAAAKNATKCASLYINQHGKRSASGRLAIDYAVEYDSLSVFQLLFLHEIPTQNVLLRAAAFDAFKIARFVREIAATQNSKSLAVKLDEKQISYLEKSIGAKTHQFGDFPDGLNGLFLAVQTGSSGVVRVLSGVLGHSKFEEMSALVYAILIDAKLTIPAWKCLIEGCHGEIFNGIDGFGKGSTALMLGVTKRKLNIEVIKMLLAYEKLIINDDGKNVVYFAEIGNRDDVKELLGIQKQQ